MDVVLRSGRLVAWGNAVLAGLVSPDTAADRVRAGDGSHRMFDTPRPGSRDHQLGDGAPPGGTTLPMLLAGLRSAGIHGLVLVLPVPGDPLGLPGPSHFNERALEAGEAVLTMGPVCWGIVPTVSPPDPDGPPGTVVHWRAETVNARAGLDLPSLSEAERSLIATAREVTAGVAALDLARWRPQLAEALAAIRNGTGAEGLAPGYPGRAHRVLALAQRLGAIADLVCTDAGGAAGVGASAARDALLRPLATAARRATVAAFNCVVEDRIAGASIT